MPGVVELGGAIVETALTFAPALLEIPVLGRILIFLAPNGGNDHKALEQMQRAANKRKLDRRTRIRENARYVLKASDAMQCVEDTLSSSSLMFAFGKGLFNVVAARGGGDAFDILFDRIFTCIESKTLSQTSRRGKRSGTFYHRPSRGHGKGRKVFGKVR